MHPWMRRSTGKRLDGSTSQTQGGHLDAWIREWKQRISEYLDRVARGEVIRATDHRRSKALQSGIPQESPIARGISEGWLKPGEKLEPSPVERVRAHRLVLELLREDRGRL